MAKFYKKLTKRIQDFIAAQKLFFVATAPKNGRINLSPKGMDSFRILNEHQVVWLSVTGSGNETAAHVEENGRMTLMFCAFVGAPNIVRLYGQAQQILPRDDRWNELIKHFTLLPGTRQLFLLDLEYAQTSCGMSIPFFEYKGQRNELNDWATAKSEEGIKAYWNDRNQESIDGLPTNIF